MKRVLILTVTAGNAHNACARAMQAELKNCGCEVQVTDLLKSCSTPLEAWLCDRGYSLAVAKFPRIYAAFYEKFRNASYAERYTCKAQITAISAVKKLYAKLASFKPDVIYCTHFYGAVALTDLRLAYNLPCKCIACTLDFVRSPFWEAGIGVDYISVAGNDFVDEFAFAGYEKRKILPLGLPVDGRATGKITMEEAQKKLNLSGDIFTVIISFGGGMWRGGYGIFKIVLSALKGRRARIIMLNGRDARSFRRIKKAKPPAGLEIINVGFTDDIPLYLACADVAVCKAGGASCAEMINAGLPMLITQRLPAQEKYNCAYLVEKGCARSFGTKEELGKIFAEIFGGEILKEMRKNLIPLQTSAIKDLAKLIAEQPTADYKDFKTDKTTLKSVKKRVKTALKYADINERKRDL